MRKNTIRDIIGNRVSQMYIDTLLFEKRNTLSKYKEVTMFQDLAHQVSTDKNIFTYLTSIPLKMVGEKPLYENEKWKKVFDLLLADKNIIHINFPNFSGQITVGNAFAKYLEEALKYSRESEFLQEIQPKNT